MFLTFFLVGFVVCRELQRAVVYSTGNAGPGEGQNFECKEHLANQRALVSVFNHSTKNQKLLKAAQETTGPKSHSVIQDR